MEPRSVVRCPNTVANAARALEVTTLWGNTVIDVLTTTHHPIVTAGDERKVVGFGPFERVVRCDVEVSSSALPTKTFVLAERQPDAADYVVNLPASADGHIERADGATIPLEALGCRTGADPGEDRAPIERSLGPDETLHLTLGAIRLRIRYVIAPRFVPPGRLASMNYTWLNILMLAAFAHGATIVGLLAVAQAPSGLTEDLLRYRGRFGIYLEEPHHVPKTRPGPLGEAKVSGPEGAPGLNHPLDKKPGRMGQKGRPDKDEIARRTLAALFGPGGLPLSPFGSGELDQGLRRALGGVTGPEIADAAGLGGHGSRGPGPGGGGLSMRPLGAPISGHGGWGNDEDRARELTGISRSKGRSDRDIFIDGHALELRGALDKGVIRQVISAHLNQIRYCYERELTRMPGLFGKVATRFTIGPDGHVEAVAIAESTLGSDAVEACIEAKIRSWVFPKPKGGGVVIVKYPFLFKTSG